MHVSDSKRVAAVDPRDRPTQFKGLPEETHIVSGVLEADGAHQLVSVEGHLSSKVIKLARSDSGGIEYQLAIFASEPRPVVERGTAPEVMPTQEQEAELYFTEKGFTPEDARKQVKRFGVQRVMAMRGKELDEELAKQAQAGPKLVPNKDPLTPEERLSFENGVNQQSKPLL